AWAPGSWRKRLIDVYSLILWLDCGFWGPDINPLDSLPEVGIPLHFCHGERDELIPFKHAHEMYDAYPGPQEGYWGSGGTNELKHAESDEYRRRLSRFFTKQLDGATEYDLPRLSN